MLGEADARSIIGSMSFSTSVVGRVGVELEWPVADRSGERPSHQVLIDALCTPELLPGGSRVSLEPGGQVELSSPPADSLPECLRVTASDVEHLRARATSRGLFLVGRGLDHRVPRRVVDSPWYEALERHYAAFGDEGYTFMCNAASVQVNVDAGPNRPGLAGHEHRWWLANQLGPMFTAMFANSPSRSWPKAASERQLLRFRTDPSRTDPPVPRGSGQETWTDYVLDARVVGIMDSESERCDPPPPGMTLRHWIRGDGPRPVTHADVQRHMKAVIPPVRACGRLELRMIDAQADDGWMVPLMVVATLLDDLRVCREASELARTMPDPPRRHHYVAAARHGLAIPALADGAGQCLRLVRDALARIDMPEAARTALAAYTERFPHQREVAAASRDAA